MPSSITQPLYDGESMSFQDFATRTARALGPWTAYERDVPLGTPLPDEFETSAPGYHDKRFHEDALELANAVSWTPEEAEMHAHQRNLHALKSHLQTIRASRANARKYTFMSAQVAAWEAPTEEHETMRTCMQQQLDDTFRFDLISQHETPPQKLSGEEHRERTVRWLASRILREGEQLDVSKANVEQANAFAKEFKDSLEGWQDVQVPRRSLP